MAQFPFTEPTSAGSLEQHTFQTAAILYGLVAGKFSIPTTNQGRAQNGVNARSVTVAGGSGFTTLPALTASAVDIVNNSGTTIDVQIGGGFIAVPTGAAPVVVHVRSNSAEIGLRRTDLGATAVTVGVLIYG